MNLKDKIKNTCLDVKGNISFKKIKPDILNEIEENTSFLNKYNPKLQERIYCIINDIHSVLYCPITNNKLNFSPQLKKYSNTREYSQNNRVVKQPANFKKLNNEKFEELVEIYKSGRYNLLNKSKCVEIFEDLMKFKNSRVTIAIAMKNLDLVCSIIHYTRFIEFKCLNLSERIYCVINNIDSLVVDDYGNILKFINRNIGYSKYPTKKDMYLELVNNASKIISENFIVNGYIKDNISGTTNRVDITCKKCNHKFDTLFKNGCWKNIYCPGCDGMVGRSKMELECCHFLKSIGIDNIVENDRVVLGGKELDIYCPNYGIAIELCGVLWHSYGYTYPNNHIEESSNKYNHRDKYDKCFSKNIQLLTIFENEWNLKKDIVKSIISNKFGKTKNKIFARKCEYSIVDKKIANLFLDKNHIQGSCQFSESFGLFYDNELISIMCFGKRKITRGVAQYELIRFCNKLDTSVIGGASKILKNCNRKNFISYCDLRYSDGNLYEKLGMTRIRKTLPNYFYTKDSVNLLHRSNFQKHKITKTPTTKTEWQIMYENGYRRIYDCGNLVFEYQNIN